jgi:predicted dinucleotide-binding enzyme
MTTIGIIGAGEVGSHIARAAIASGYNVVIANSRGPETLTELVTQLGPMARAATAAQATVAGDFIVVAVPLKLVNDMPVEALAGKVVIDTNNYMSGGTGTIQSWIRARRPSTSFARSSSRPRKWSRRSPTYRRHGS